MATQLSSNIYYSMHQFNTVDKVFSAIKEDTLRTLFLHHGSIELEVDTQSETKKISLKSQQGIIILPGVKLSIIENNSYFIVVQSIEDDKPIIDITIDDDGIRSENSINQYKIIEKPKTITKPWGHEVWIAWFKNHHVLKKIYMEEGNKCSLQYHEEKSETNIIVSGKANVLKDIKLEDNISEEEALKVYNETKDIDNLITAMSTGDYWDNKPFEIHRVFSIDSYTAYEASTPQLDDVIRLQDENNRVSGFIKSEHE